MSLRFEWNRQYTFIVMSGALPLWAHARRHHRCAPRSMWIHLYSALSSSSHGMAWEFKRWKIVRNRLHIVKPRAFIPPEGKQWTKTQTNFVMRFVGNGNIYILTISCFVWFVRRSIRIDGASHWNIIVVVIRNTTVGIVRIMMTDDVSLVSLSRPTRYRIFDDKLTRESRWDRILGNNASTLKS